MSEPERRRSEMVLDNTSIALEMMINTVRLCFSFKDEYAAAVFYEDLSSRLLRGEEIGVKLSHPKQGEKS